MHAFLPDPNDPSGLIQRLLLDADDIPDA
jgi:hypothetical protein